LALGTEAGNESRSRNQIESTDDKTKPGRNRNLGRGRGIPEQKEENWVPPKIIEREKPIWRTTESQLEQKAKPVNRPGARLSGALGGKPNRSWRKSLDQRQQHPRVGNRSGKTANSERNRDRNDGSDLGCTPTANQLTHGRTDWGGGHWNKRSSLKPKPEQIQQNSKRKNEQHI
jgi:hypothetical protein